MRLPHRSVCVGILAVVSWLALTGCKPSASPKAGQISPPPGRGSSASGNGVAHLPSVDDLAAFLRASAPAWERITDVRMDPPVPLPGASPASHAWLLNAKFTIMPTEDLLAPATAQDSHGFQTTMGELGALSRWADAYARSSYSRSYPALQVQAPATSPQLLSVTQPKDHPFAPTYGKLAADWQVDHWNFGAVDVNLPETGQPRGQFSGSTLVLGSPEAEHLLAAAKVTIAQAQPQKAAIEQSYRADLLKATQPGALYRGQIRHRGSTVTAEVRLAAPPAGTDPQQEVQLEVRLPATPNEAFIYLAQRAERLPLRLVAPTGPEASISASGEADPLPKGDLTLRFVSASGKEGAYNDTIPVAMLDIINHRQQPSEVFLNIRDGRLEGRINGYSTDSVGFVLSTQQDH